MRSWSIPKCISMKGTAYLKLLPREELNDEGNQG